MTHLHTPPYPCFHFTGLPTLLFDLRARKSNTRTTLLDLNDQFQISMELWGFDTPNCVLLTELWQTWYSVKTRCFPAPRAFVEDLTRTMQLLTAIYHDLRSCNENEDTKSPSKAWKKMAVNPMIVSCISQPSNLLQSRLQAIGRQINGAKHTHISKDHKIE